MIPSSKTDATEWKNPEDFYGKQYPTTNDCKILNEHLNKINEDIATLAFLRESSANRPGYKDAVKNQIHPNQRYLLLLQANKKALISTNCSTPSPTVNNATIPNTTVKNETPKTDVLPSTNSPTVDNATVPPGVVEENTGFAQYATPQNGAIVLGAIILLVAVYFATKKKTTTSKTN